jgi:hypothetical protein
LLRQFLFHEDKNLKMELRALAELQDTDGKVAVIKNRAINCQCTDHRQFVLPDTVLYCTGDNT